MPNTTIHIELSADEQAALRGEFAEPYGHEIRVGILGKLRTALDAPSPEQGAVQPPEFVDGGKRCNVERSETGGDWWVGYGKESSCQIEGPWAHWVVLAAKILREPATAIVAPNLHRPDLELTPEQERNYTELGGEFDDK